MSADLSPTERLILPHLARDLSDAEIGTVLGLSTNTIHAYVEHMSLVMGARDRAEAVYLSAMALPCMDALPRVAS